MEAGRINGWRCRFCQGFTYAVHLASGTTPMFLACRAEGVDPKHATCQGMADSLMYPDVDPPAHVLGEVQWEWYVPSHGQRKRLDPGLRDHIERGGLLLRPITDKGRKLLPKAAA